VSRENRRPFCAEISSESGEPIAGTASRVDHWLLVEYRGVWNHEALAGSGLNDQVKAALRARIAALRPAKLLFVRRRERRDRKSLAVFFARSLPGREIVARGRISGYDELLELDFDDLPPLEHPLFLVCTHGKHDPCCARHGRPLYDVLADQAEEEWVWQTTHIGGDRFAGNVVVLPEGLYYGRVQPEEGWTLLDEHLGGRVYLERFRGRSTQPFPVQAAEIALREREGMRQIAGVTVEEARRHGRHWAVRLRADRQVYEIDLAVEDGPLTYLTCGAEMLRHPPRYAVGTPRALDA
jgi:hypothetical protein